MYIVILKPRKLNMLHRSLAVTCLPELLNIINANSNSWIDGRLAVVTIHLLPSSHLEKIATQNVRDWTPDSIGIV